VLTKTVCIKVQHKIQFSYSQLVFFSAYNNGLAKLRLTDIVFQLLFFNLAFRPCWTERRWAV